MKTSAMEDYNDIAKRQKIIAANRRHECLVRLDLPSAECWCFKAGPNGSHLPCPPPPGEIALTEVSCG